MIYLHPFEQSFREILKDPNIPFIRAIFWIMCGGAGAGFLVSATNNDPSLPIEIALCMGVFLVPPIATLVFVFISLMVHGARKFSTKEDANKFVYCIAAALAPAILIYGFLLAASQVLVKFSLNFDPVIKALVVILSIYLIWLVANAFNAITFLPPKIIRIPDSCS